MTTPDQIARLSRLSPSKRARLLEALRNEINRAENNQTIPRRASPGPAPLSCAQQRMWFLNQLAPESSSYCDHAALRLEGQLDITALERGLNEILRRHEILRTTISNHNGQPQQAITPFQPIALPVSNLQELPLPERQHEVQRQATAEAQQPFDLSCGPLLRARLVKLASDAHLLLLTMHHIVTDGWSWQVLLRELAALYDAFCHGYPSPLPELPIQYTDFADWQQAWITSPLLEQSLTYWKERLAGAPPVIQLPTDRPKPAIQSFRGASRMLLLPPALVDQLRVLADHEGMTLYMVLLAGFQMLLHHYSGQLDIVVGSPVANRTRPELEPLIGVFVNPLVLRTDFAGNPTFRTLLSRVREVCLGAYAHQDLPFEKLVDELQPERNLSHQPLFQVSFVLQNATRSALEFPGLRLSMAEQAVHAAKFDLTLSLADTGSAMQATMEYSTDLFDGTTIERMLRHLRQLLMAAVANPDQRLADISPLNAPELRQLLGDWNQTQRNYPRHICVHQLFEAQVERTPDLPALIYEDSCLTYRQLNARANQLAHALQSLGVGPEVLVGICVERSLDMVIGILGTLKAGGAYVPLDPAHPADRLAFLLEDTQIAVLLSQQHLLPQLPPHAARVILLDADGPHIEGQCEANPHSAVQPSHLIHVFYTSGSTGKPKGAMVTHAGVADCLRWFQEAYQLTGQDRMIQKAPLSFDVMAWELFWPLSAGACVIIARPGGHMDSAYLLDLIATQQVTHIKFVPSLLHVFLEEHNLSACEGLRRVFCGGEALPVELQERFFARLGVKLHNIYGPTETSIFASFWQCQPGSFTNIPIGRPIANTTLYILNRYGHPVPVGVIGELYIGGTVVGRGYLNRPDLTAERFIPDPFGATPGARLYRTGDLARYRVDGSVEFLGRVDYQVKVHGVRVELGEIEAILLQHASVRAASVIQREDAPGDKRLVAYVVPYPEQQAVSGDLRRFLKEYLPEYMVPALFVVLEALPLMANGKVNRQLLPPPVIVRTGTEAADRPSSNIEAQLAEIWATVLRIDSVGIHDNFFELGGDSILGLQVIARAHQLGFQLAPRQLFQYQTVAELATAVGVAQPRDADQGVVSGPLPLTPAQQWFFEWHETEPQYFNQVLALQARQRLEPQPLAQAVAALLHHHDALRLRFEHDTSGWHQINDPACTTLPFSVIDLSALDPTEQAAARAAAITRLQTGFDLTHGPLVRVTLFEAGPEQPQYLLIIVHHLVIDGVSWRILLEDLLSAYHQLQQQQPVQLPPKTTSLKRWAERLVEYAKSDALRGTTSYWMADGWQRAPSLPLDGLGDSAADSATPAPIVSVSLPQATTQALLREAPRRYGAQINEVLLTAWSMALARWTGSPWQLIDLESHGREDLFEDVDLSRTVGWFTAIYPVLVAVESSNDPAISLKAIKAQLRAIPHGGIGYGLLRYLSQDTSRTSQLQALPAAQISFNYLGQFDQMLPENALFEVSSAGGAAQQSRQQQRRYLIEVDSYIIDGCLRLDVRYSQHAHSAATIEQLAQATLEQLCVLATQNQAPVPHSFAPTDFPDSGLDQAELDSLMAQLSDPIVY